MINFDIARQESLKNKNRIFLMEWVEYNFVSEIERSETPVKGYWSIINYCPNHNKPSVMLTIPDRDSTFCVAVNGVIMVWKEKKISK